MKEEASLYKIAVTLNKIRDLEKFKMKNYAI